MNLNMKQFACNICCETFYFFTEFFFLKIRGSSQKAKLRQLIPVNIMISVNHISLEHQPGTGNRKDLCLQQKKHRPQQPEHSTIQKIFTDTQLSRHAPGTGMVLIKHFINQNPSFISYLATCKMPHVCIIHVKIFFKISEKSHFWLCSIYNNEILT